MASYADVIEGLEIFARLCKMGRSTHGILARHDVIYAGGIKRNGPEEDVPDEDRKRLDELGWYWDSDMESWARCV
jgi:hypothetical protein